MAGLVGTKELQRRLDAIGLTFRKVGQKWSREAKGVAVAHTPVRSGRLRRSYRIRTTDTRSTIRAHYTAYFVDAGPKAHAIVPKTAGRLAFAKGGQTIFARKVNHPGYGARPYRQLAATEGMRRTSQADEMIALWNGAA